VTIANDTIAAISTAAGRGGIGIVRVSGDQARKIAQTITHRELEPNRFIYTPFYDEQSAVLDFGLALYFQRPASYTGEDVVEFQGHGGPAVLQLLLNCVLALGVRQARAGEFTERAFLNNKIDLAQAEAVSDLIDSVSASAAKAAVRSLRGDFSTQVHHLTELLINLRVYVEAALDFAEEEIDFLSSSELSARAAELEAEFQRILQDAHQGQLLKDGLTLVIAGKPNVGKSSLLNCLTGTNSAIVTEIAGTTRDVLREHIHLNGLPLHILDTAGIRESDDPIEQEGVRRARSEITHADRVLWVTDVEDNGIEDKDLSLPVGIPVDRIVNKIDLCSMSALIEYDPSGTEARINLSAKTGQGVDLLTQHLQRSVGYQQDTESVFLARSRHVSALKLAYSATQSALEKLRQQNQPELAAEDLRSAQTALNEITGEFSNDDLLGRIFAGFCIGK